MQGELSGELVWHRRNGRIVLNVLDSNVAKHANGRRSDLAPLRIGALTVFPTASAKGLDVVYRHPIDMQRVDDHWRSGPVFAILGGSEPGSFSGSRANFRDIMKVAADEGRFIYVVPPESVTRQGVWRGYVRLGFQRWLSIPCPQPQAVYNRVPTRNMERSTVVASAKRTLRSLNIPLFNPEYFNKNVIYRALERSPAHTYLPEATRLDGLPSLAGMLRRHATVYLKPAGGSIGHGIIRVEVAERSGYDVAVLKNGRCANHHAGQLNQAWALVRQHRLPGEYVIQAGKQLIRFRERPCDFRVLTQKNEHDWEIVGIGVRVAGPDTITTHVPNGGTIADAKTVLTATFGKDAQDYERALHDMIRTCASALDTHYGGELGEMSMDVGMDEEGQLWFFEANAKPMKFDEPDIRFGSIRGILNRLEQLALERSTDSNRR